MKTCTVCGVPKDEGDFYYDSATDRLTSKCIPCMKRYNAIYRAFKRMGMKLTTKEFRDSKLYKGAGNY